MAFQFEERRLVQVNRDANRFRFYTIAIEDNLLGDKSLVVHWGRIGRMGNTRIDASGDKNMIVRRAMLLEKRKRRSGYSLDT